MTDELIGLVQYNFDILMTWLVVELTDIPDLLDDQARWRQSYGTERRQKFISRKNDEILSTKFQVDWAEEVSPFLFRQPSDE